MSKRKDLNIEIEKKQSRKKKQTPEKKLERLLNPLRNAKGKLPQLYLTTEAGKEILALALVYEKELGGWDVITELLERKTTIIHNAMRKHQLTRNRLAGARNYSDRTSWNSNPDVCKLIEDYFKHSKKLQTGNELNTLKKNLLAVVAQSLKRTVTWNSVLIFAKDKEWRGWGMSNKERENADRVIFDEILRNKTLSPQEMRDKLKQTLHIKDRGLLYRAKQLDITLPALNRPQAREKEQKPEKSKEEMLGNVALEIRKRNDPPILDVDINEWEKQTIRVGFVSGISYHNSGFRAGAVLAGFEKLRDECTRFNILVGLLIDKQGFKQKLGDLVEQKKEDLREAVEAAREEGWRTPKFSVAELREEAENDLIKDTVSALSSFIPKTRVKHPDGTEEFVRLYIITSSTYDGPYADRIARELHALRKDVRIHDRTSRTWVRDINQYIAGLTPMKNRLPSQYYSTVIEREIRDERHRTDRIPYIWAVGPFASNVYTPGGGVHRESYISLPGLRSLERVTTAENQIGVTVLDFMCSANLPLKRSWSLREQIKNERDFIMPPRGATELQRKIIQIIQKRRGELVSVIHDFLQEHSRDEIKEAINELVEETPSRFKTWPGLHVNESDRYDFHLEWVQERLRYTWPTDLTEDRGLYFGCMHFGYTTTDYEHILGYPRIILENNITHIFGLGDFVAGAKHDLPHSGEVIAGFNYTDQEKFAAEGLATIIFKVFSERFKNELENLKVVKEPISSQTLEAMLNRSLLYFPYIPGNHDMWVLKDGHTPLAIFHNRLIELLLHHIGKTLAENNMPFVNIVEILNKHIIHFEDVEAEYDLPSGLRVGMLHPYEGRSKTTTLKLQGLLSAEEHCHIWAIANYHQATTMREWNGLLGERVGIMVGAAGPYYTFFERRKRQRLNDFGPIYLRTLSRDKKIVMDEIGYFNKPIITKRISKYTNPDNLKKKLGLLTI